MAASYAELTSLRVTPKPHSRSTSPVRRAPAAGERASSFGFELEERRALVRREPAHTARLFDAAFEPLHGYIARMVRDPHLAEDLTQETFLRIQRGLPTYRPEFPLRPWLFTIASNVLRDHFSALRERAFDVHALEGELDEPIADIETPASGAARGERATDTKRALTQLSEQARAVLVLRHYHAFSFAEIASTLRISTDTARQRYLRALARLRSRLAGHAPPDGDQT